MWIPRSVYTALVERATSAETALAETRAALAFAHTSFDWMKSRISEIDYERNQLMQQVTAIPARKLEIAERPRDADEDPLTGDTPSAYSPDLVTSDLGDDLATKLGIPYQSAHETLLGDDLSRAADNGQPDDE